MYESAVNDNAEDFSKVAVDAYRTVIIGVKFVSTSVTRAVVVAILYLSCRCDVRMYGSCAGVVTRGLPLRGRSAVRPVFL